MLIEFEGKRPRVGQNVFIAPNAVLIGDVEIGDDSSVWFGAVLRGDFGPIRVGPGCSVQDNVVLHVFQDAPTVLEENVTVGHNCTLEGCHVGAGSVVGMNCVILPHARLGRQVMVAAGSVVGEGAEFPDRVLVAGTPATVKKKLGGSALAWIGRAAADYRAMQARYRALGIGVPGEEETGA